ncbi:MAG TPA: signal peptidase II [Steroidobacteraceae bacterium]|jgi:signal peptidase II|nr:signal peptidase II [Steroidobacteraceae bacterium]
MAARGSLPYVWMSLAIVVLDQLTKAWIVAKIGLYQAVNVLPVLQITHVYNRGAAFSFLNDASGWQRWAFAALAVIVSVLLLGWLRQIDRREVALAGGVALVLGGAIGNLIDRLRLGRVVDFVAVHWGPHYFPTFNLADSAITVGVILWLADAWLEARHKAR